MDTKGTAKAEQLARELATTATTIQEVNDLFFAGENDRIDPTNTIECVNSAIRKYTRNRKLYPSPENAVKLTYLAIAEAAKKWTMPIPGWKQALNHFAILFEGCLPLIAKH